MYGKPIRFKKRSQPTEPTLVSHSVTNVVSIGERYDLHGRKLIGWTFDMNLMFSDKTTQVVPMVRAQTEGGAIENDQVVRGDPWSQMILTFNSLLPERANFHPNYVSKESLEIEEARQKLPVMFAQIGVVSQEEVGTDLQRILHQSHKAK